MNPIGKTWISRRLAPTAGLAVLAMAIVWGGYRVAEQYYVTSEIDAAARRAAPYVTSIISVLERYQVLPPILAEDVEIIEAAEGAEDNRGRIHSRNRDVA